MVKICLFEQCWKDPSSLRWYFPCSVGLNKRILFSYWPCLTGISLNSFTKFNLRNIHKIKIRNLHVQYHTYGDLSWNVVLYVWRQRLIFLSAENIRQFERSKGTNQTCFKNDDLPWPIILHENIVLLVSLFL